MHENVILSIIVNVSLYLSVFMQNHNNECPDCSGTGQVNALLTLGERVKRKTTCKRCRGSGQLPARR